MSHFTVLVPADNVCELHDKLLPFHEYESTGYLEYTEWTPASLIDAEREMAEINEKYAKEGEEYTTLADFLRGWHGYSQNEQGEWGHRTNQNRRWDWYSVGGRWSGLLRLKPGCTGENGEGGIMSEANDDPQHADVALADDIDWEWMRRKRIEETRERWHDWRKLADVNAEADLILRAAEDDAKEIQKAKAMVSHAVFELGFITVRDGEAADLDTLSEEEYVEKYGELGAITHAFITLKGEWKEDSEMGWFGMSGEKVQEYNDEFWRFIKDLDPDQRLFVCDCHI